MRSFNLHDLIIGSHVQSIASITSHAVSMALESQLYQFKNSEQQFFTSTFYHLKVFDLLYKRHQIQIHVLSGAVQLYMPLLFLLLPNLSLQKSKAV
jgi:hypothetical protein